MQGHVQKYSFIQYSFNQYLLSTQLLSGTKDRKMNERGMIPALVDLKIRHDVQSLNKFKCDECFPSEIWEYHAYAFT